MPTTRSYVLGAGVTGLAAGIACGFPIIEAAPHAGGICRSYEKGIYGSPARAGMSDSYRFEVGGGHWIHTRYPSVTDFLRLFTPLDVYERRSAVYLAEHDCYIPYPLQEHVHALPDRIAAKVREEQGATRPLRGPTMQDHFEHRFGPTLCGLFFHPFHELYTAGLYSTLAPQDAYKTPPPGDGTARQPGHGVGYNATFAYPRNGFGPMIEQWTRLTAIEFGTRVVEIDTERKHVGLQHGGADYSTLISTLPLHAMQQMTQIRTAQEPDPYTSVLVINIGATRGPRCPEFHWVYFPVSASGFHRVGMYSNVSRSFLPARQDGEARAGFYVECSYPPDARPTVEEIGLRCAAVTDELRAMGYIHQVEVVDPTWVDVAYTWRRPGSHWVEELLEALRRYSIHQAGRYASWQSYGIADSIRDGFLQGKALAESDRAQDSEAYQALSRLDAV